MGAGSVLVYVIGVLDICLLLCMLGDPCVLALSAGKEGVGPWCGAADERGEL